MENWFLIFLVGLTVGMGSGTVYGFWIAERWIKNVD